MSKIIFQDSPQQALFEKQGFLIVPLLNDNDLAELNSLFDQLHPDISPGAGFVSGSYSSDAGYKQHVSDEIVRIFSKHYERLFTNYQPFGGAFLYKMPNPNSQLSIHQDWTIVDEEKYVALNCWVPLTDVDATNGALHAVPATHYDKINTLRAPTLPFFFSGNDDVIERASIPMYVKAGKAVILNQRVIHFSPPNNSNRIRKAITARIKTKGAPMIFHYKDHSDPLPRLERFAMPENFLIGFENFMTDISQRPKMGSSVGFVDFEMPSYPREDLIKKIESLKKSVGFETELKTKPANIFEGIAKLFAA